MDPTDSSTRTDEITRRLREEVLRGQYRPGERLPSERDLAERFATTRGVVRVALKKLEQLGLAAVGQGGARVVPVEDASLDVVGHLLDLENPPNPDLVDQVLEVVEALMAASARIAVERGDVAHLLRVRQAIERARETELGDEPDDDARREVVHDLIHSIIEASDNLVLHIVRKGLRTQVFGRLFDATWRAHSPIADGQRVFTALDRAIEEREPAAASEAVHALFRLMRVQVRRSLEEARSMSAVAAR